MKISTDELLALIAGAEAKGAIEQRYRDESTTFAPSTVPVQDVPASIQKPSTYPFPCWAFHHGSLTWGEYDEHGQLVRTHKMVPNANLPSSLAALQNCGKSEAEPSSRHHENGLPQGLPSAEELAELYCNTRHSIDQGWPDWETAKQSPRLLTYLLPSIQAVRDAVLLAQEIDRLGAKVRELEAELAKEGERADHNHKMFCKKQDELFVSEQNRKKVEAENEQHKTYIAKYAARIQELEQELDGAIFKQTTLEAQLAALGTPVKRYIGEDVMVKATIRDDTRPGGGSLLQIGSQTIEYRTGIITYPVPNAPTE